MMMPKTQNIYLMNLSDVMNEYKPVYRDGNWDETMKLFLNNKHDLEVIEELKKDLLKTGGFREPVILLNDEGNKIVADGTHRIITSFIVGAEKILIADDYDPTTISTYFCTHMNFLEKIEEDSTDEIVEIFRSFKLNEKIWINCDLVSFNHEKDNSVTFFWSECVNHDDKFIKMLNKLIHEKMTKNFPTIKYSLITEINKFEDDVWDEDERPTSMNNVDV